MVGIVDGWTFIADWAANLWADILPKMLQFGSNLWNWISSPTTWQNFQKATVDNWTAFSKWAGDAWTTVQPKLIQFRRCAEMDRRKRAGAFQVGRRVQ